jgi:heat shock protein HslJ
MASSVDPASLVLQDDGTLVGTTGCQRFTGTWTVAGDEVHVDRFRTEGGCTPAVDQDARIVEVLSGGFSFVIREQSLDLYELGSDSGLSYTTGLR